MRRILLKVLIIAVLSGVFSGCSDEEGSVYFYARFSADGTDYSFENGITGNDPYSGVDLTGDPASFTSDSPGILLLQIYATRDRHPSSDLSGVTNGYLKLTVNENCTNTNTYNNVSYRFRHPDRAGLYYANGCDLTITQYGIPGSGVIEASFTVTLTNETRQDELTLTGGTIRTRLLPHDAATLLLSSF